MGKRTVNRRAVLEQMMALAAGAANDVVKLAYLTQEQTQEIDTLDLGCLTEFKRNSSGAVEVKLTDRAAVLEKLLEQLKDEEDVYKRQLGGSGGRRQKLPPQTDRRDCGKGRGTGPGKPRWPEAPDRWYRLSWRSGSW